MKRLIAILAVLVLALAACGGDSGGDGGSDEGDGGTVSGDAGAGEDIFSSTCTACHGPDAMGLEGLGTQLVDNEFIQGHSDDELVEYLTVGRATDDPANTTGVAMPPKGGNPSLTESDLYDVVAYLRTLQ